MNTVRTTVPVLALTLALSIGGCTSPTDGTAPAEPAAGATPTAQEAATTATATTPASGAEDDGAGASDGAGAEEAHRLSGLADYPVEVTPEPGWSRAAIEKGTLTYTAAGGITVISVHAVEELAGVPAADLPEDVAAFLQEQRPDIVLSDVTAMTLSGRDAHRFTVTMSEGSTPTDLWRVVEGSGYKPLPEEPMEVVAVRSSQGLVLLWTESTTDRREATLAAFEAALERVVVG